MNHLKINNLFYNVFSTLFNTRSDKKNKNKKLSQYNCTELLRNSECNSALKSYSHLCGQMDRPFGLKEDEAPKISRQSAHNGG
jgi:hypothetical protein